MATLRIKDAEGKWTKVPLLGSYKALEECEQAKTDAQNAANVATNIGDKFANLDSVNDKCDLTLQTISNTDIDNKLMQVTQKASEANESALQAANSANEAKAYRDAASAIVTPDGLSALVNQNTASINKIFTDVTLTAYERIKYSYIAGERTPAGTYKTKRFFIPSNTKSIHLEVTSQAYYDVYGFVGDDITTAISYVREGGAAKSYNLDITNIPLNAKSFYITSTTDNIDNAIITFKIPKSSSAFNGETIVWYGTSIPAAGKIGKDNYNSYPMRVGAKLGANVINEAVGTSCMNCKNPALVSDINPYGFTNNFERASRCLTNSLAEMEWIINHFDDRRVFSYLTVSSLSESDKEFIRSCSYERKLMPYLYAERNVDVFVFDHGHNEEITDEKENLYDTITTKPNLYCFRGAMEFMLEKIYSYKPNAKVVIIGEYENQKRPIIAKYQKVVADEWSIPIYKQWENYGWTQKVITTKYRWDNGYLVEGATDNTITLLDLHLADTVHPHSDRSGNTLEFMAQHIAAWLNTLKLK